MRKGGPKPKPTALKLVIGSQKRNINRFEPKPTPGMPSPPAELSKDAREEWDRIAPELRRVGILTLVDRSVLAAYCMAYGRWIVAERQWKKISETEGAILGGLTVETKNRFMTTHPLIGIANKAAADMVRYAAELGMTPSSRSRIRGETEIADADPSAKYFG